jgi:hypothetical protein
LAPNQPVRQFRRLGFEQLHFLSKAPVVSAQSLQISTVIFFSERISAVGTYT